jgi:hypothetical protein
MAVFLDHKSFRQNNWGQNNFSLCFLRLLVAIFWNHKTDETHESFLRFIGKIIFWVEPALCAGFLHLRSPFKRI